MDIIYILVNAAMPGYVKIGQTNNLEKRMRGLHTEGVPLPFECFYACTVKDAAFVEKQLHNAFDDHRPNKKREFFQISPDRVAAALKLREIEDVTPKKDVVESQEDQQALDQARAIRGKINFNLVKIPVGAELVFVNSDEKIKAKVVDDRSIEFNGETTTLSSSAKKILRRDYGVNGSLYWMYEGETLDERRGRLERGE